MDVSGARIYDQNCIAEDQIFDGAIPDNIIYRSVLKAVASCMPVSHVFNQWL
jgi:hypothetical protein